MNYIKIPDFALEGIINSLQQGYHVCAGVDYSSKETEKRPEYATGYSRATLRDAIERLKQYQKEIN